MGDFDAEEIPGDPTDPESLAQGGNFRVMTDHGVLDVMQWVPGVEGDPVYDGLAADALEGAVFGATERVCSLDALRAMKRAADRPIDRQDLDALG